MLGTFLGCKWTYIADRAWERVEIIAVSITLYSTDGNRFLSLAFQWPCLCANRLAAKKFCSLSTHRLITCFVLQIKQSCYPQQHYSAGLYNEGCEVFCEVGTDIYV
jgi:hypothetical protein